VSNVLPEGTGGWKLKEGKDDAFRSKDGQQCMSEEGCDGVVHRRTDTVVLLIEERSCPLTREIPLEASSSLDRVRNE
jgi:hypothetical protein